MRLLDLTQHLLIRLLESPSHRHLMKRIISTRACILRLLLRIFLLTYLIFSGASIATKWFHSVRTTGLKYTQGKVVSVIPTISNITGPDRFPEQTIYSYEIKVEYKVSGSLLVGSPSQYNINYPYYVGEMVTVQYDPANATKFELKAPIHPVSFPYILLFLGLFVVYMLAEIVIHRIMKREQTGGVGKTLR